MTTKYQLIKIGEDNSFYSEILEVLYYHITELGLQKECIIELTKSILLQSIKQMHQHIAFILLVHREVLPIKTF